jgi:hypothetical protein
VNRGVLYQFNGRVCGEELYYSILSLRKNGGANAKLPIYVDHIVPDDAGREWALKVASLDVLVDEVDQSFITEGDHLNHRRDRHLRLQNLKDLPFPLTLRLDTDTLILADPEPLFQVAECQGIAGVLDHWKPWRQSLRNDKIRQINGGVLCFHEEHAKSIAGTMQEYIDLGMIDRYHPSDQLPLNTALDDLEFHGPEMELPLEWNKPGLDAPVSICHWYSFAHNDKRLTDRRRKIYAELDRWKNSSAS